MEDTETTNGMGIMDEEFVVVSMDGAEAGKVAEIGETRPIIHNGSCRLNELGRVNPFSLTGTRLPGQL
ncbi:unnamed protein product [Prunus armeniaca]